MPIYLYLNTPSPVTYYDSKIQKPLYSNVRSKNKQKYIEKRRIMFDAINSPTPESQEILKEIEYKQEKKLWTTFYNSHPAVEFMRKLPKKIVEFIKSAIYELPIFDCEYKWEFNMINVSKIMINHLVDVLKILCPDIYYFVEYNRDSGYVYIVLNIYWDKENMDDIAFNKYIFEK